jgi:hypothetical protein
MMRLYHFTCAHRAPRIMDDLVVRPNRQPLLRHDALSWWTTAAAPPAAALGLAGRTIVKCDRMAFRFVAVDVDGIRPWTAVREDYPLSCVRALEAAHGARPALWWVAVEPVTVRPS